MPEYIDKEKLIRDLIDNRSFYPAIVKKAIEDAPIADVVPRSEVELLRKQLEPFRGIQCSTCKYYLETLHAPCYRCKEFSEYIWLSADIETSENSIQDEVAQAKQDVVRKIFEEFECNISTGIRILKDCINDTDTDQVKRCLLGRMQELCGMEKFIANLKKKYIGE